MNNQYDIIIVGAGPAGCCSALSLQNSNLKIALLEKDEFPRHKICGDGVCDRSINTLRTISQKYYDEFMAMETPQAISKTDLVYKGKHHTLNFKNFGYTCSRYEFDNFLFNLVKRDCTNINIIENTQIAHSERSNSGVILTDSKGKTYEAPIVIIGNGAKSKIAEQLSGQAWDKSKNGVAIRAYYKGVTNMNEDTIELHYKKEYFPGYLWIFPLKNGEANVGFGYHLADADKHKNKIQDILEEWINTDSKLKERFKNATMISKMQGGLIPYNSNEFNCIGNNYMITGDAANLIDPISGGGIGSAMYSGHIAALQAEKCCASKNFTIDEIKNYEILLKKRVEKEMRTRFKLQKIISKNTWLLDIFAKLAASSSILNKISNWYLK